MIREGRNAIGRGRDTDTSLFYDACVSHPIHAKIVFHADGECAIQDNLSSSGTFINGKKIGIGAISPMCSGDILKVGASMFKVFLLDKSDFTALVPSMRASQAQR